MSIEPTHSSKANSFLSKPKRPRPSARTRRGAGVSGAGNEPKAQFEEADSRNHDVGKPQASSKTIEEVFHAKGRSRKRHRQQAIASLGYEQETRRPIVCLAFVLPFLLFYEIGSILLGNESFRSGVDQWLHSMLQQLGFGELVVLPLMTIGVLIVWHHRNDDHWRIHPKVLGGMLVEAIGLGLILFWAAKAISLVAAPETSSAIGTSSWELAVTYVGSGIYEELLFRIVLLIPFIHWARTFVDSKKLSSVIGVIAVSLLFAAAHYNIFIPAGNEFEVSSFVFRFVASIAFCTLFLFRGFGVAVGAHVAYDLLTQV
jgi:hypothetical protein